MYAFHSTINSGAFKMGSNVAETYLESFLRIQCEPHHHLTENSRRKIEWNSFPLIQENDFPFGRNFAAIEIVVFGRMKSVPCARSMPQFSKKYYRGNYRNFNILIFWKFRKKFSYLCLHFKNLNGTTSWKPDFHDANKQLLVKILTVNVVLFC